MLRHRTTVVCALAATALLASTMSASASPSRVQGPTDARQSSGGSNEFVVLLDDQAAGLESIEAAGGSLVDMNEQIGLALVHTDNAEFIGAVNGQDGVVAAARNHSIGTSEPGMPHRFAEERPADVDRAAAAETAAPSETQQAERRRRGDEPLLDRQWNMSMIGATRGEAHRRATGKGVDVGIIDTGVDASHPDIAPNFDHERSRNFTMDIPEVDGPCEVPTCIDPADVDDGGHGTHVAGIVAADNNRFGVGGVAPNANIVNLRAGQDSGYFFIYETVAALTEAGDLGLDVVNMSYFVDPWEFNCASRDDYVEGEVSDEELAEQALIRELSIAAVNYAHERGVTLVAAAGNSHLDLAAPTRVDEGSPDFPPGTEHPRVITNNCLDLPSEGPNVIQVSSLGPSTTKSGFSNYGSPNIEVSAPGGWFRDFFGTPEFQTAGNLVLSSYPLDVAIEEGLVDENGNPVDEFSVKYCDDKGTCGIYTYLQGTSMASPHATGVAALIVDEHGRRGRGGKSLDPDKVLQIMSETATDHECPAGGEEDYTDEGRPPDWNAKCIGDAAYNSLYGEGIVSAVNAVR